MRLIRVSYVCDLPQQSGKNMWRVRDNFGRIYDVPVNSVSASNRSYWIWV